MRVPRAWVAWAAAVLLAPPVAALAPPVPATASDSVPDEAAFATLASLRAPDGRYRRDTGASFDHIADQFLAILALVERGRSFPTLAAQTRQDATATWRAAEAGWDAGDSFYHVTTAADSKCVSLETNAWAMLASQALGNATSDADVARRAVAVAATLSEVVAPTGSRTREACSVGPSQWALGVWALLEYAEAAQDTKAASAALERLRSEVRDMFDVAFRDPTGVYVALTNLQYLLALQRAVAYDGSLAPTREAVSRFVQQHLLGSLEEQLTVRSVERQGGVYAPVTGVYPVDQLWAAYALHQERLAGLLTVSEAPERLLAALVARHWSTEVGGFATPDQGRAPAPNAIAAILTRSVAVTSSVPSDPLVSLVVPAVRAFTYPPPGTPGADAYHVLNEWDIRFRIEPSAPGPQQVLLAGSSVGPLRLGYPVTPYTPMPRVLRPGQSQPLATSVVLGPAPLLSFEANLAGPLELVLTAYAPVVATQSNAGRVVQLYLSNAGPQTLTLAELRLALAMADVEITQVRANGQVLPPNQFEANRVERTTALPQRHMGIEVRNVEIQPGGSNEILIAYEDDQPPRVGEVRVTRDAAGREAARTSRSGEALVHRLGAEGQGYVWAKVHDNALLRSVRVALDDGNGTLLPMRPAGGGSDLFVAELPPGLLPRDEGVGFRVLGADEWDNLGQNNDSLALKAETSFFKEGEPILFVFSATLFASAAVIYVKMGRRRPPG